MLSVNKIAQKVAYLTLISVVVAADAFADGDMTSGNSSKNNRANDKSQNIKLGTGTTARQAVRPKEMGIMQGNTAETRHIDLAVNKAAILRLPRPSRDVVVANPELMDIVVRSPQELYLFAKKPGFTNAFIFDDQGNQIVNMEVNIGLDVKDLERIFKEQIPESNIKISNMADTIILSGNVKNAAYAKMARDIAQRMVTSPEKVINNIGVTGQEQVMIKVKVAEMQRTILKQLGIDWNTAFKFGKITGGFGLVNGFGANGTPATGLVGSALNSGNLVSNPIGRLPAFANSSAVTTYLSQLETAIEYNLGIIDDARSRIQELQDVTPQTGLQSQLIAQQQGIINTSSGIIDKNTREVLQINNQLNNSTAIDDGELALRSRSAGFTGENVAIDNLLKALERHSLLKTLAEPNLTALSGESAKFLAGGELPYLVAQTFGQASVDFKPYGIGLAFTPLVLNEGRISLKVSTEISDISETVTAGNSSYPGLSVRRAETTVEMPSGGTMAMAGLIRDDTRRSIDSTPGLKEVPVLGPLFRSNDFKNSQSELVVLVTPYLVNPASEKDFVLPTDGYSNPSDMDMYLRGRMAAVYDNDKEADQTKSSDTGGLSEMFTSEKTGTSISNKDEYIME